MEPADPRVAALAALAAEFANPDGTDRWHLWPGVADNGIVYAWLIRSSPPVVVRDTTLAGLRARMVTVQRVLAETRSAAQALAAAERLET